jgi:hypothetical protein
VGQRAVELRNEWVDMTPDDHRKRVITTTHDLLPSVTIDESSIVVSSLTDGAAPLLASYSFSAAQFATRTEKRLMLRPALLGHRDESLLPDPARSNSVYFHYPWSESERVIIKAPAGYTAEQPPDPIDIDIGAARYRSTFTLDGRDLIYERHLTVNAIIFRVDQYPTVKAFFDRVQQADRTEVSFKQF